MKRQVVSARIVVGLIAGIVGIYGISLVEAGSGTGRITYFVISTVPSGQESFVVRFSTMSNIPGCSTGNRFAMSAADPKYKSTLAMM